MKNSLLLTVVMIAFSVSATNAWAWHLECSFGGDGDFGSDDIYLWFQSSLYAESNAGWGVLNASEDPDTGEVWVEYDEWGEDYDELTSYGGASFQILSDFGNEEPVSVEIFVQGYATALGETWVEGRQDDLEADGVSLVDLWSDFGGSVILLEVDGYESDWQSDEFAEPLTLMSNTLYQIDIMMEAVAETSFMGGLPDRFDSWADYYAYFDDGDFGSITRTAEVELECSLEITSVEVPEPATVWLLGFGILALTRRRKPRT